MKMIFMNYIVVWLWSYAFVFVCCNSEKMELCSNQPYTFFIEKWHGLSEPLLASSFLVVLISGDCTCCTSLYGRGPLIFAF